MAYRIRETARLTALTGALAIFGVAMAAEEPTPTPTPRPAGGQSLTDIAKDKKLKGDSAGSSSGSIVITNENLADYASKGGLTTAKPTGKNAATRGVHAGTNVKIIDSETSEESKRKHYWQQKYLQQLDRIATIKHQLEELDLEIPALWTDFYARDDPMYRDGVIKPKLDRSLKRRDDLAALLLEEEPKPAQIKEEARRDGAEPGWWRDIKEPTPRPKNPKTGPGNAIRADDRKLTEQPK